MNGVEMLTAMYLVIAVVRMSSSDVLDCGSSLGAHLEPSEFQNAQVQNILTPFV